MIIVGIMADPQVSTGGARRYLELLHQMAARGHTILWLKNGVLKNNGPPPHLHTLAILCRASRPAVGWSLYYAWRVYCSRAEIRRALSGYMQEAKPPVLFIVYGSGNALAALVLRRIYRPGILIFDPRENVVANLPVLRRARRGIKHKLWCTLQLRKEKCYEFLLGRIVDRWWFQSAEDAESHRSRIHFSQHRVSIIANSPNTARLQEQDAGCNTSTAMRRVLFCGALTIPKGIMELVVAVAQIVPKCPDISLDIIGAGSQEQAIRHYVNANSLNSVIRMHGRLETPIPYMKKCDILVVPSYYESQPDIVLEALWVGIPIIGSRVSGIAYYLKAHELLFSPTSAPEIAHKLILLYNSSTEYQSVKALCTAQASRINWRRNWIDDVEMECTRAAAQ